MRTVLAIGGYIYTQDADGSVAVNQYIGNTARLNIAGNLVDLKMETAMPWNGASTVTVNGEGEFSLRFRLPEWAKYENSVSINGENVSAAANEDGYIVLDREWTRGDVIDLNFPMEAERIYSDEKVTTNKGLVAIRRGPIVYCAEGVDNEIMKSLYSVVVATDAEIRVNELARLAGRPGEDHFGVENCVTLTVDASYHGSMMTEMETGELTLIPYAMWGNRGTTLMQVFLNEDSIEDAPLESYATPSASFEHFNYNLLAKYLNDGINFNLANNWSTYDTPNAVGTDWCQYEFETPVRIWGSFVSWKHDGNGVKVPVGLIIKYWDGESWQEAAHITDSSKFPINSTSVTNGEGHYEFDTVTTTKIRLYPQNPNATSQSGQFAIMEWRLEGEALTKAELLIAELGEITLDSGDAIAAARAAYDKLPAEKQETVANYAELVAAEKAYAQLKEAAEKADQAAAEAVDAKIGAIGEVTLDSEDAIEAAREAYEALTDAQKALARR